MPARQRGVALLGRAAELPEPNVALFAWLLNFPWEFWQVPFYEGAATAQHWSAIKSCSGAILGDAAITVGAFWAVAITARSRRWILQPRRRDVALFVVAGTGATVILEWRATRLLGRWAYAASMPVVPVLGVGLLPLLQWVVLPPLVVWFVRRHLT